MTVIYLVSQLNPSGPINQALNIVTGLKSLGVTIYLVTLFQEREVTKLNDFLEAGINVVQLHCSRKNILKAAIRLHKLVRDFDVNIVHSSGISADFVNVLSHHKAAKMCTIRSHIKDLHERRNVFVRIISQMIYKNTLSKLDAIVACSKSLANDITDEIGNVCSYVRNGVDMKNFFPVSTQEKERIRRNFKIPLDKRVYITVGSLEPRKNISTIIEAMKQCNPEMFLLVVGGGPERVRLEEMARNNNNIKFFGKVSNPLELYQCSDIFISSSLAEGFPNTVLEAMACGLPVILSDIGPHQELFEHDNEIGELFQRRNVYSLEKKIKASTSWNWHDKSMRARNIIVNRLNKYCVAANYINIYNQVLEA